MLSYGSHGQQTLRGGRQDILFFLQVLRAGPRAFRHNWSSWSSNIYVNVASLLNKLVETLKQENAMQWNSTSLFMTLINKTRPGLGHILHLQGFELVSKATKIDHELQKEFITFPVPFEEATLALEVFTEPILHRLSDFWRNLLTHFQAVTASITSKEKYGTLATMMKEAPIYTALKLKFAELVEHIFVWNDIYVIAALQNCNTNLYLDNSGIDFVDNFKLSKRS